jgi:hypothetical protein
MEGVDELGYLLAQEMAITRYEQSHDEGRLPR